MDHAADRSVYGRFGHCQSLFTFPSKLGQQSEVRSSLQGVQSSDTTYGDQMQEADQSMVERTQIPIGRGRRRSISFRRPLKNPVRVFSKRSIFGESRCSHRAAPCEQSVDFDVETDDEDDIKVPAVLTKQRRPNDNAVTKQDCNADQEECTVTTRDMSLADGIPAVIYIVHESFLAKVNKKNLLKRIHVSFRNAMSKGQLLDDSDEEAYDETLVEL